MKTLATLGLAAIMLTLTPRADATTVLQVDVPEMTAVSQWVVRAHVTAVTPVDTRAAGGGIFTDVHLLVREAYLGSAPKQYTMRLPGGSTADGLTLMIPGMPRFTPGEDVVLFLEKTALGHIPAGLGQGVWRLSLDAHGAWWVEQSTGTVHLMRRDQAGRLRAAPGAMHTPARTLNELVAEIYASQLP